MLIATGTLTRQSLAGQIAIVTGAGGGIGYEAARALAWLGAQVIIAEVNERTGQAAAEAIGREIGAGTAVFIHTDVGTSAASNTWPKRQRASSAKWTSSSTTPLSRL